MKNMLKIALTAFAFAALCGPAFAQNETAAPPGEETKAAAPAAPALKTAAVKKKPVKKKKKAKKKVPAPVSEYKFKAADAPPAYRFDKKANPIIKAKPKAKASSKKGKKNKKVKKSTDKDAPNTAEQPIPKLQKASGFDEEAQSNNPANNPASNTANTPEEGQ